MAVSNTKIKLKLSAGSSLLKKENFSGVKSGGSQEGNEGIKINSINQIMKIQKAGRKNRNMFL
tara:strand:+ start:235 stop:423 length:189 start_codon:yes stop_codon:yes gene_type:complete